MRSIKTFVYAVCTAIFSVFMVACSSGTSDLQYNYAAKAAKELDTDTYSVILKDMDYNEAKDQYLHKYAIVYRPKDNQDTLLRKVSSWYAVNEVYFDDHKNDLGMSILRMDEGKPSISAAPPGFANFIGNEKYGEWREVEGEAPVAMATTDSTAMDSTGTSTAGTTNTYRRSGFHWFFFPRFGYMGGMFGTQYRAPTQSSWNNYNTNYKPRNSSYYGQIGQNGKYNYGTQSDFAKQSGPSSRWNGKDTAFRSRVRTRVARSAGVSRASGRYGTSGGLRSRGGGFGK